jgi:hypothetical protein
VRGRRADCQYQLPCPCSFGFGVALQLASDHGAYGRPAWQFPLLVHGSRSREGELLATDADAVADGPAESCPPNSSRVRRPRANCYAARMSRKHNARKERIGLSPVNRPRSYVVHRPHRGMRTVMEDVADSGRRFIDSIDPMRKVAVHLMARLETKYSQATTCYGISGWFRDVLEPDVWTTIRCPADHAQFLDQLRKSYQSRRIRCCHR